MGKIPIADGLQKLAADYQEDDALPEFEGSLILREAGSDAAERKFIADRFLEAMGPASGRSEVVAVRKKTSGARTEAFNVFQKAVKEKLGGYSNTNSSWFCGQIQEIKRILATGFSVGSTTRNVVELLPFRACLDAASKCDVDQDGVRHLLLCRVVMGNTAPVRVMSKGSNTNIVIPDGADSGVDRVVNPRRYFMSTALMNSHIYPQYVVSFKAPNCLIGVSSSCTTAPPLMVSSGVVSSRMLDSRLADLKWGVVKTFLPTNAELVAGFLKEKIETGSGPFPELDIYGKSGIEPWVIWNDFQAIKFPHQDYIYFFSRVKKLAKSKAGIRFTRTIGDGGTWSETEPAKSVSLEGQNMQGKLRKFRYEHKDKNFDHHAEWLMDEYTLENCPSDLALCRIKMNDGTRGRKKKEGFGSVQNQDE